MSQLQQAPETYSRASEQEFRNEMERRDRETFKRDRHVQLPDGIGIEFFDTVTKARYRLTVASGVLTLTAL